LFVDATEAAASLRTIPSLLSRRYVGFVAVLPSLSLDPASLRLLESEHIEIADLDVGNTLLISLPTKPPVAAGAAGSPRGRPGGRSFGALLQCWLVCCGLEKQCGSASEAYDRIAQYFRMHPDRTITVPGRASFASARSYARRAASEPCSWYRHREGLPAQLASE
jgi:hypothetical protein